MANDDRASDWDAEDETDRAYELWLDKKLGVAQ